MPLLQMQSMRFKKLLLLPLQTLLLSAVVPVIASPFVHMAIILAVTAFCLIHLYRRREKMSCMAGMMLAMTTAMMASLPIGFLLGIQFPSHMEAVSLASSLLGMATGFLAGKFVSLMAAMDGMASGLMSGLMGAMLGVMTANPAALIMLMDIAVIAIAATVILLIREEEKLFENWLDPKTNPPDAMEEKRNLDET